MNYFYEEDDEEDDEEVTNSGTEQDEEELDLDEGEEGEESKKGNSDGSSTEGGEEGDGEEGDGEDGDGEDGDGEEGDGEDGDNSDRREDKKDDKKDSTDKKGQDGQGQDGQGQDGQGDKKGQDGQGEQKGQDGKGEKKGQDGQGGQNGNKGPSESGSQGKGPNGNGNPSGTGGADQLAQKGGEEVAKKGGEELAKKGAEQAATNAATSSAAGASAGAAGGAAAGAGGAAAGAGATAAAAPLAYVLFWVLVVIVAIIIIVGIIMFFMTAPGMVMEKLKQLFGEMASAIASWFGADSTKQIEDDEIYEVLNYLEQMGYDLKGYGFIDEDADSSNANYDKKQGVIRNPDSGKIEDVDDDEDTDEAISNIINLYIMSDNYAYTVKNFNNVTTWWSGVAWIQAIGQHIGSLFGADNTKWGKGLISIKYESGDKLAESGSAYSGAKTLGWDGIELDADTKKLRIRRGWGASWMEYGLDGWTGRYGMPLEFLLSVHIATMKPDLTYEMITNFETDVLILLHSVEDSKVNTFYQTDSGNWISQKSVNEKIELFDEPKNWFTKFCNWLDNQCISDKEAKELRDLGFEPAEGCTCSNVEIKCREACVTVTKDDKGNITSITHNPSADVCKCNANCTCKRTVNPCQKCRDKWEVIIEALASSQSYDFDTYVPYISKVTNHWYRDVYFVLNENEAKTLQLTTTDIDYETLRDERWTLYEMYDSGLEAGNYVLYKYDESKDQGIGEKYTNDTDGDGVKGTQIDADMEGVKVIKKAESVNASELASQGVIEMSGGKWSAYKVGDVKSEKSRLYTDEEAKDKNSKDGVDFYDNLYYETDFASSVVQKDDGVRTVTNSTIKDMFLNRYYFSFDGTTETANIIKELKEKLGMDFGEVKTSDLDKTFDLTVEYDNKGKIETKTVEDVRVRDYASTVSLTQDSLAAFSMLENTHTLDADYIYKDFKELVVELGYFTKEELSDGRPRLMQFLIPDIGSCGFPIRSLDKKENEYGTEAHSKADYEANVKNTLAEKAKEASEQEHSSGGFVDNNSNTENIEGLNINPNVNIENGIGSLEIIGRCDFSVGTAEAPDGGYSSTTTVNGVTYKNYKQTRYPNSKDYTVNDSGPISSHGCSVTSSAIILSGYGIDKTPVELAEQLGWSLQSNNRVADVALTGNGVEAEWFDCSGTQALEKITQAAAEGKPVIALMGAGGSVSWTSGGHFVTILGVKDDGTPLVSDPYREDGQHNEACPQQLSEMCDYMKGVAIPLQAPKGTGGAYEGFEGGEAVVSPVTGILLDYGTYEKVVTDDENIDQNNNDNQAGEKKEEYRENSDRKDKVDPVGYAKILILNEEISDQLVTCTSERHKKEALANPDIQIGEGLITIDATKSKDEEAIEKLTDFQKAIYGYSLFTREYEDAQIGGYILYIDGFKCELPAEQTDTDDTDDNTEVKLGNGQELTMDYFIEKAAKGTNDSSFTKTTYEETKYEADPVYNLISEAIENKEKARSKAKELSSNLYYFNGSLNGETKDMLIIKEGTVIGRTYSNEELVTEVRNESMTVVNDEGQTVSANEEVQGNYLRIILRDLDDTVVENVEEYMKLDEIGSKGLYGDLEAITETSTKEEKIIAAMSYLVDQGFSPEGAAGILGNLFQESRLSPKADNGSHYGMAQWSYSGSPDSPSGGRWKTILDWMQDNGYNKDSFAGQIRAIVESPDANGYTQYFEQMKAATSVSEAADIWCRHYEICGNYDTEVPKRTTFGEDALKVYYGQISEFPHS